MTARKVSGIILSSHHLGFLFPNLGIKGSILFLLDDIEGKIFLDHPAAVLHTSTLKQGKMEEIFK